MEVGLWIYINLDFRTERNVQIQDQLHKSGIDPSKIVRLSATAMKNGHLGCTMSHIRALKWALTTHVEWIAVLEDDFMWNDHVTALCSIDNILKANMTDNMFDVLVGHVNPIVPNVPESRYPHLHLSRVISADATSMYIIRRSYIPVLLEAWARGACAMMLGGSPISYTVDKTWQPLQREMGRFYATIPYLGKQVSNNSDTQVPL